MIRKEVFDMYYRYRKNRSYISAVCICILIIIAVLFAILSSLYIAGLEPLFPIYAKKYAEAVTEEAVTKASNEIFADNINTAVLNETGNNVTLLNSDIKELNNIKSKFNSSVSEIIESDKSGIKIPIGSITGMAIFSGMGFEVPVYAKPIVITTSEFYEEFTDAGINQTRHKTYLKICVDITFIYSKLEHRETVNSTILISNGIIVGAVPNIITSPTNSVNP